MVSPKLLAAAAASAFSLCAAPARAQFHDPEGAFKMKAALLLEDRLERIAQYEMRTNGMAETEFAIETDEARIRKEYEERGSEFYADGVTPIPGNESPGTKPIDPRVVNGLRDPMWKKIHVEGNNEIQQSPVEADALVGVEDETVEQGFDYLVGWEFLYEDGNQEANFAALLMASPNKIVRRTCFGCAATHQEIYYKRIAPESPKVEELLNDFKYHWTSAENTIHVHFELYSTYEDAVSGANPWQYCDYDELNIGFPGNCGPDGPAEGQWGTFSPRTGQLNVAFHIESSAAPEAFQISDVEAANEAALRADPVAGRKNGPCWNHVMLDKRRACWRACEYAKYGRRIGALSLCRALQQEGQNWAAKVSAMLDYGADGQGAEKGGKIHAIHPLGNDDGLPNAGIY